MSTYQFERGFDDEARIVDQDGNVVAEMEEDRIIGGDALLWRAAAAVLAPSDGLILAIAKALAAAIDGEPWDQQDMEYRDAWIGAAYRVRDTLRTHVTGGTP